MGDQIFVRGAVIENLDVCGGLDEDFGVGSGEGGSAGQRNK